MGSSYGVAKRQKNGNNRATAVQVASVAANVNRDISPAPTSCRQYDHHDLTVALAQNHQKEGEKWLSEEEERLKLLYLKDPPQYVPFHCQKKDGTVPKTHLEDAFKEYYRRFGQSTATDTSPSVLLVATGVTTEWRVPEEVRCASFLLFPELGAAKKSALFVTYMPGPEHGAVDSIFVEILGEWRRSNRILKTSLSAGGLSSGGYGHVQPDKRLFPLKNNRDHAGQDRDRGNKNNPYSRFIWEVEYDNRNPVEIRERGKAYLTPHYTRLFLAVKLYIPSDGTYEAAAVLWGKSDENSETVTVMRAVSFGTEDLSDDHKEEFRQRKADRLIGVNVDQWERPQNNAASWLITLPFRGFLFKVSEGEPEEGQEVKYVLDDIDDDVDDLVVDLRELVTEYENQVLK